MTKNLVIFLLLTFFQSGVMPPVCFSKSFRIYSQFVLTTIHRSSSVITVYSPVLLYMEALASINPKDMFFRLKKKKLFGYTLLLFKDCVCL